MDRHPPTLACLALLAAMAICAGEAAWHAQPPCQLTLLWCGCCCHGSRPVAGMGLLPAHNLLTKPALAHACRCRRPRGHHGAPCTSDPFLDPLDPFPEPCTDYPLSSMQGASTGSSNTAAEVGTAPVVLPGFAATKPGNRKLLSHHV